MTPKMILFDYGGTLMDEPDFNALNGEKAVFAHIKENPDNVTPEESVRLATQIFNDYKAVRDAGFEMTERQNLKIQYEMQRITFDISYEELEEIYWDGCGDSRVLPGVPEMLDYLDRKGIRTGVISNIQWSGDALSHRIRRLLPQNSFEFIIASSDFGYRKPRKELFELALQKAKLRPEEVWYCGNEYPYDVEGAAAAGIFPVLYRGKALGEVPHLAVSKWQEFVSYLEQSGQE